MKYQIEQLQQLIYEFTMEAINDDYNHNVEGDDTVQAGISWNYVDADCRIDFSSEVGGSNFSTLNGILTKDEYYDIWNAIVDDYLASVEGKQDEH